MDPQQAVLFGSRRRRKRTSGAQSYKCQISNHIKYCFSISQLIGEALKVDVYEVQDLTQNTISLCRALYLLIRWYRVIFCIEGLQVIEVQPLVGGVGWLADSYTPGKHRKGQ